MSRANLAMFERSDLRST